MTKKIKVRQYESPVTEMENDTSDKVSYKLIDKTDKESSKSSKKWH